MILYLEEKEPIGTLGVVPAIQEITAYNSIATPLLGRYKIINILIDFFTAANNQEHATNNSIASY